MIDVAHPDVVATGEITLAAPARLDALATLRSFVRSFVAALAGNADVSDDLELVVSELATNVVEHTASDTLSISLERTETAWVVDVAGADGLPAIGEIDAPDPDSAQGRGLFLVASISDDLEVVDTDGVATIRCSIGDTTSVRRRV